MNYEQQPQTDPIHVQADFISRISMRQLSACVCAGVCVSVCVGRLIEGRTGVVAQGNAASHWLFLGAPAEQTEF